MLKGDGTLTLKPGLPPEVLPTLTFTSDGLSPRVITMPLAALLRPNGRLCIIQFVRQSSLLLSTAPDRIVFGAMVVSTALVTLNYNNGLVGFAQRDVPAAGSSSASCAAARSCRDVETYVSESNSCRHPCSSRWFYKYDAATLQCTATNVIPYSIFVIAAVLVSIEFALVMVNVKAGIIVYSPPFPRSPTRAPHALPSSPNLSRFLIELTPAQSRQVPLAPVHERLVTQAHARYV